jgi:hypothetical protein
MSICSLPSDMLIFIVSFLPDLKTRFALSNTSKILFSNCPEICDILKRDHAMLYYTIKIEKFACDSFEITYDRSYKWQKRNKLVMFFGDMRVGPDGIAYYDPDNTDYYRNRGMCGPKIYDPNSENFPNRLICHPYGETCEIAMTKITEKRNIEALRWLMVQKEWKIIKRIGSKNEETKIFVKSQSHLKLIGPPSVSKRSEILHPPPFRNVLKLFFRFFYGFYFFVLFFLLGFAYLSILGVKN